MPELPEVETVRRELEHAVVGKTISDVLVLHSMVIRGITPAAFKKGVTGSRITAVTRRGKLLIIQLSSGKFLTAHLKMTGQFLYPGTGAQARVRFCFSGTDSMDFNDRRLFAELRLLDDWRELSFVKALGPEPFDISADEFSRMLGAKTTKVKPLLMDQSFLSGVGNLYAAETLFRARIHPARPACRLSAEEKGRLFKELISTLKEAIRHNGSSIDQYVRISGLPGDYATHHKVYGREGKPCVICGAPVSRITLGGRGTYLCSRCQT